LPLPWCSCWDSSGWARCGRSLGVLNWRLDQMDVTRPTRLGREGLKVGTIAPDFTLPDVAGRDVSLHDFARSRVLLVFTQAGCGPCHDIAPELNRLQARGEYDVVVVNNGDPDETRQWAAEVGAHYPVLRQDKFRLSKKYEIFATPFAFVIDEQGVITSNGIVGSAQYLGYVPAGVGNLQKTHRDEAERDQPVERESERPTHAKELSHV
jgi:peroxiredoxin